MATEEPHSKPKRKKIFWACNHCNKAHITCEAARPCSRCIKKGLQDTCEDAPRKRKKYLADMAGLDISRAPEFAQNALGTARDDSNLQFNMDMSQSMKDSSGLGVENASPIYEATQFQQSTSLPGYLMQKQPAKSRPALAGDAIQRPPSSLFAREGPSEALYGESTGRLMSRYTPNQIGQTQLETTPTSSQYTENNGQYPETRNHNFSENGEFPQIPSHEGSRDPSLYNNQYASRDSSGAQGNASLSTHKTVMQEKKAPSFLSSAADMEYATLSSILQDNFMGISHTHSIASTEGTPASMNMSPAISPHSYNDVQKVSPSSALATASYNAIDYPHTASRPIGPQPRGSGLQVYQYNETSEFPPFDSRINQYLLGNTTHYSNVNYPEVSEAMENLKQTNPGAFYARGSKSSLSFTMNFPPNSDFSRNLLFKDPEEIYVKIKKPFSYTPGFHKLIAYLRKRFPREMLVKMAESMAVYRPSFIACTNSLRESDLIFMEQCFQRTLLTYDNFIKVSGTPTIVWRRTGEIAYVGHEFTTLTGWTQDHLLGGNPTFIVELLDDESVVEYFQLFSKIAFGDFLGATMTECTLLTPKSNVKIRAGCSWTMKRDVFGIPMMIIGNFLPIL